jgi:ribosomal protein S1
MSISLSIKALSEDEETATIKDYKKKSSGSTVTSAPTLGDLFKRMDK